MRSNAALQVATSLIALLACALALGEESAARGEATLAAALARPASGSWSKAELGAALRRLSASFDCPIWLDRRVDPTTRFDLAVGPTNLAGVLNRIAESCDLGATRLGGIVYIGPSASTLAARPKPREPRLRRARELRWDRLTEPRELIRRVAGKNRLRLANPDAIPHDLWEAGSLPALSVADRFTLLLVGFGLTWDVEPSDARTIRVSALSPRVDERHARLESRPPQRDNAAALQWYTLNVRDQPLEAVAKQLSAAFGVRVRFDPSVPATDRGRRVSFRVEEASQQATLDALAAAGGLKATHEPGVVVFSLLAD